MNKYFKKGIALAIVGIMTLGMGTTVFAEETGNTTTTGTGLKTSATGISDTSAITLQKDYVNGSESQQNTNSPAETFTFTIDRYGLWNVGEDGNGKAKYNKDNMPTFSNSGTTPPTNTFTIEATAGAAGTNPTTKPSVQLTVPTYNAVGDYWYKVTEMDNNTAGVIYGTNDSETEDTTSANGAHERVYYIHVQVTNGAKKEEYIRTVTLHKTAPDVTSVITNADYETWYSNNNKNTEGQNDKKVADIQNKYYAGSLNIKKTVTGNAGDKNELFQVTVTFKNESKANMNSDITYKNFYKADGTQTTAATSLSWTDTVGTNDTATTHTNETKEVKFYVKDGTTVMFDNIPYGVTYTVTETQPSDDKYTHTFKHEKEDVTVTFDGVSLAADGVTAESTDISKTAAEKWNEAKATGSISDDSDTITITNNKTSVIDIGVMTSDAPYVALLLLIGIVVVVFIRKKSIIEE
ncbi:DUF7601 domain-containing protein [Candidatus Merdisoma sp. HCP28S3_D10]|uniref:DUF7601 domain-containing protein n=1 Tax=unclassified Candidatus Merdisoma TaxID=3099611 RepID=UPI003F89205E